MPGATPAPPPGPNAASSAECDRWWLVGDGVVVAAVGVTVPLSVPLLLRE